LLRIEFKMIFKTLVLLVVFCYAHSSPVSLESEKTEKVFISPAQDSKLIQKATPSVESTIQAQPAESTEITSEKKLNRQVRNNKVEYVYLNSEGEIIPKEHLKPKNVLTRLDESQNTYLLKNSDETDKVALKEKEKRSTEFVAGDLKSEDNGDALHYSVGGVKIMRGETRARSTALPSASTSGSGASPQALYSNVDANLLNLNAAVPLLTSSAINYPSVVPSIYYDPLIGGQYINPLLSESVLPSTSTLSAGLINRAAVSTGNNLLSRTFFSPIAYSTPNINPFTPYLIPQPYLNGGFGLLGNGIGAYGLMGNGIGLNGYGLNGMNSVFRSTLFSPYSYTGLPQGYELLSRRVSATPVEPFSDSAQSVVTSAPTAVVAGVTDAEALIEKPSLYSSVNNAALLNGVGVNRMLSPISAYPTSRYFSYPQYPQYNYLPIAPHWPYYTPSRMIAAPYQTGYYPPIAYPYVSPMHYSAQPSVAKKTDQTENKPVAAKEEPVVYLKKTESKETVSRLSHQNTHTVLQDEKS